ncbi:MAG: T9SS type A sorting domain-containing protein [Bacteroidota bacterium]
MRQFIVFLLCYFSLSNAWTQSISPSVLGSAGSQIIGTSAQVDQTVGEAVIATLSGPNTLLTQGFHQPMVLLDAVQEPERLQARIYPNPTAGQAWVELEGGAEPLRITITDMRGVEIAHYGSLQPAQKHTLDLSVLPAGIYLLRIQSPSGGLPGIYKIKKTN